MEFRLNKKIVRRVSGFADEDQNEGYAEFAAMSPEDRVALVGYLHKQYVHCVLNLAEFPPMNRRAARVVDGRPADE